MEETGMDTEEAVPHEHFWYWKIFATTCITVICKAHMRREL